MTSIRSLRDGIAEFRTAAVLMICLIFSGSGCSVQPPPLLSIDAAATNANRLGDWPAEFGVESAAEPIDEWNRLSLRLDDVENDHWTALHRALAHLVRYSAFPAAESLLDELQQRHWPVDAIQAARTELNLARGRVVEAAETLAGLRERRPHDPAVRWLVALSAEVECRSQDATNELTAWLNENPDCLAALIRRGWLSHRAGRIDRALSDWDAVLAKNPQAWSARHGKGRLLLEAGNADEAVVELTYARMAEPLDSMILIDRAAAYDALDQTADAENDRREAIRVDQRRREIAGELYDAVGLWRIREFAAAH